MKTTETAPTRTLEMIIRVPDEQVLYLAVSILIDANFSQFSLDDLIPSLKSIPGVIEVTDLMPDYSEIECLDMDDLPGMRDKSDLIGGETDL
jgi:hypothetical protein